MKILELINATRQQHRRESPDLYIALTTLYSECLAKGKNAGNREPTDDECIATIKKFIDGQEQILAHRPDDVKATNEILAYRSLLPTELDEIQLRFRISESGHTTLKDIMSYLKTNFAGRYDGAMASKVAKEFC